MTLESSLAMMLQNIQFFRQPTVVSATTTESLLTGFFDDMASAGFGKTGRKKRTEDNRTQDLKMVNYYKIDQIQLFNFIVRNGTTNDQRTSDEIVKLK